MTTGLRPVVEWCGVSLFEFPALLDDGDRCTAPAVTGQDRLNEGDQRRKDLRDTVNSRTKSLDVRGADSSVLLILRGGIPRSIGNFPETHSQRFLRIIRLRIDRSAPLEYLSAPATPIFIIVSFVAHAPCRTVTQRTSHPIDSFQTGSGQTGSSQKCRNSPNQFSWENMSQYAKMLQHVCTRSNTLQNVWDLWPFCENPVCPNPVWKPVIQGPGRLERAVTTLAVLDTSYTN